MFSRTSVHNNNHNLMLQFPAPLMDRSRTSWKPNIEQAPNCPRCSSSNTKFCYYNNYSLSQPRYFCKACRRYWTKGGSLRNIPLGGGCRESRRGKAAKQPRLHSERSPMTYTRSFSENSDSEHKGDGSDIDMAVVFAKFLYQNLNIVGEGLSGTELQGLLGGDDLGIQAVLWSEDATTSFYSSTCWQPPMMELQQLENSMPPWNEEYGQFPMNISDGWSHWSCFDLSTFGRI